MISVSYFVLDPNFEFFTLATAFELLFYAQFGNIDP